MSQSVPGRVAYLDGLRGFAALQVLVQHYVSFFSAAIGNIDPQIPHPAWQDYFIHSPLYVFGDGYVAVSIFFLISGMVLTYSFEASAASVPSQVMRRLTRLGLPMAVSVLLGALWFTLLPHAHLQAGDILQDAWTKLPSPPPIGILPLAREIFICGLLFGHAHFSLILPGVLGERLGLPSLIRSYNDPLWTLHLEFWGSLLVLALAVSKRGLQAGAHAAVCGLLALGFIAHPLGLFVLGYLTAQLLRTDGWQRFVRRRFAAVLGIAALVLGASMSAHVAPALVMRFYDYLTAFEKLPMRADEFHFYSQYGAILIFFGVLLLPPVQIGLSSRLGRVLGRYSFSLYLVHFPILMTVTAAMLVWAQPLGPVISVGLPVAIGLAVTLLFAVLFERLVDVPATVLSRRIKIFPANTWRA